MPAAISPAEELKQLQTELEQNQSDAARIKARMADLAKTAGDIDQKTKDFEKAAAASEKTIQELREYVDCRKKALEAKVDKAAVAQKKKDAEDKLQALKKAAEDAAKAVGDREKDVAAAKADVDAKQKAYDDVAGRKARNAEILKELDTLKAAAGKQGDNPSREYFLILLMIDRLNELKLTPPADYAKELEAAGAALAEAVGKLRAAEQQLEKAKADEKAAAKAYQDAKAKFVETALATVTPGDTPPPPPPQPPPPQPPSPNPDPVP